MKGPNMGYTLNIEPTATLPTLEERTAIRKNAGLSLTQMAALTGCSYQSMWHWENGSRTPRPLQAKAYAQTLTNLS